MEQRWAGTLDVEHGELLVPPVLTGFSRLCVLKLALESCDTGGRAVTRENPGPYLGSGNDAFMPRFVWLRGQDLNL